MDSCIMPKDIVVEILSRLPLKTLIQFRSVSKSWLSLISSHNFIRMHLSRTSDKNSSLIFDCFDLHSFQNFISFFNFDSPTYLVELDPSLYHGNIVGSCNGLVLLTDRIWNPAMKQSKLLPPYSIHTFCLSFLGFGFNSVTSDFKVVRVAYQQYPTRVRVEVYSLNADSWREIEVASEAEVHCDEYIPFCIAIVKGNPYWSASSGKELVSFDMYKETFRKVPLPDIGTQERTHFCNILQFQEALAVIVYPRWELLSDMSLSVWTMDGVCSEKGSWTRKVTCEIKFEIVWPFAYLKTGMIMCNSMRGMFIYDPERNETLDVEVSSPALYRRIYNYTESLYSVQGSNKSE